MTHTKRSDEFETRLSSYLHDLDSDKPSAVEDFYEGLSEDERKQFSELADAARLLRQSLGVPLHRGQMIGGRYKLEVHIGAGGFGAVWRAWDRTLLRKVAVKFLSVSGDHDLDLSRFQTEVQALVRTVYGGVPQLYDVGIHDGEFYIVLEYVEGRSLLRIFEELRMCDDGTAKVTNEDLRQAVRYPKKPDAIDLCHGNCRFRAAARICAAVLRTVETMHEAGIRHRDIKPSNVMLRGGGNPVVVDFGLAARHTIESRRKTSEGLSGTLPFLAPEQLKNQQTGIDGRTDVYQVGLLLYEFCTLKPAFEADDGENLVDAILGSRFLPPRTIRPSIPRDLERICLMALANGAEQRYQTAEVFRRDLERWLGGVKPPVVLEGGGFGLWLLRMPYFVRRRARLLLVILGACVGAAVAMVFSVAFGL